jgi:hypothetical protein
LLKTRTKKGNSPERFHHIGEASMTDKEEPSIEEQARLAEMVAIAEQNDLFRQKPTLNVMVTLFLGLVSDFSLTFQPWLVT